MATASREKGTSVRRRHGGRGAREGTAADLGAGVSNGGAAPAPAVGGGSSWLRQPSGGGELGAAPASEGGG